jgi:hypothetical protein
MKDDSDIGMTFEEFQKIYAEVLHESNRSKKHKNKKKIETKFYPLRIIK